MLNFQKLFVLSKKTKFEVKIQKLVKTQRENLALGQFTIAK
jgi:hypothetical protein